MPSSLAEKRTREAFLWASFLKTPFMALYVLLGFILSKDLHASAFQISLLIILKPVMSLFTPYWSSWIYNRPDLLRLNIICAGIISYLPFFLFPFIRNSWIIIAAGALFLMMHRSVIPAWMEIFKQNVALRTRENTFASGSSVSHLGGAFLALAFGKLLDLYPGSWQILFPLASLIGLVEIVFLSRIPPLPFTLERPLIKDSFQTKLIKPWKAAFTLLKQRPDFLRFQIGFMLGGGGLMLMQPVLPSFFTQELGLSYTAIAVAIAACKGFGFVTTSRPFWAKILHRFSIYTLSSVVTLLTALFALSLICASITLPCLYIAYLIYGMMQAGSEMTWHFSGPLFAKEKDSAPYSSVNIIAVGLRGLVAPLCGSLLACFVGPTNTLGCGALFCGLAALHLGWSARVYGQDLDARALKEKNIK